MGTVGARQANHAHRTPEQARNRINGKRKWALIPAVLEHSQWRKLFEDGREARRCPPGRIQERPVKVRDYREETVKLRIDLVHPVIKNRATDALQYLRSARERLQ